MAPLRYAAKFDPFLSLDCAPTPSTLAQSKERKGSNFAIWQPREQALAAVTEDPVDAYKLKRHTVGEMRRRFPFLNWEAFFRGAFEGVAGEGGDDRRIKVRSGRGCVCIPLPANEVFSSQCHAYSNVN